MRTLVKAAVCYFGFHEWDDNNRCTRCGRVGCAVGHHDWTEIDRQIVISPRPYANRGLSDDGYIGLAVTKTTRLFYECSVCGKRAKRSHVEEGYAGRA
jgi:hypothetical protein